MGWNSNGKQLERKLNSNVFWNELPQHRQTMFKRAFGLLDSRVPAKKQRQKQFPKDHIVGPIGNYQEDFMESRQFVDDIFENWAYRLKAQKSQVVHAFITGSPGGLAMALQRAYDKRKLLDAALAAAPDDWHVSIMETFRRAVGLMTHHERQLASQDKEMAKKKEDDAAKAKGNFNTSKPNAMKGVQVSNKKQAGRAKVKATA